MKVIDLTHKIYTAMPVYPGTEAPTIYKSTTLIEHGFEESKISMCSHTGTHMDAPAHMLSNAHYLEDFHMENFIGKATILDFSDSNKKFIDVNMLEQHEDTIKKVDFVLLKTRWDKYWGQNEYFENFPALTEESAKWLCGFNLKGIGIDTISIDSMSSIFFPIHNIIMSKNILIIENLTNLEKVTMKYFLLSVLPLKYIHADGSPVRAVAIDLNTY